MKSCILDIETESVTPTDGRIICIGAMDADVEKVVVFHDPDEKQMLARFVGYYERNGFEEIIGFNVLFDVRFLFAKCLKYGIPARRLFSSKFTDLMMTLKSVRNIYNFNRPGTLNEWVSFLFNEVKSLDASTVPLLYSQGKIQDVIEYNKKDVELTHRLWKRIRLVLDNDYPEGLDLRSVPSGGDGVREDNNPHG